jgi:hypothetical protein
LAGLRDPLLHWHKDCEIPIPVHGCPLVFEQEKKMWQRRLARGKDHAGVSHEQAQEDVKKIVPSQLIDPEERELREPMVIMPVTSEGIDRIILWKGGKDGKQPLVRGRSQRMGNDGTTIEMPPEIEIVRRTGPEAKATTNRDEVGEGFPLLPGHDAPGDQHRGERGRHQPKA